ncbi:hypothetical protein FA13DRAFT_1719978 [Coprinellus micaceus]|uniref:Uncharacterized protein n=1 Tax=Coprinellus micaceus TaxID=71717 RepID=A0A4Y7SA21_COPMI|nr:hypothetical protein FA13DRAFT_1719978 [Coprinellus micaceus]
MCCGPEPNALPLTSRIRSTTSPFCQTWRSIPSRATLRASKERAKTTEGDSRRTVTESGGGQEECGGGGGGGERGRKLPRRHEANAVPKLFCMTGRQNQKTFREPIDSEEKGTSALLRRSLCQWPFDWSLKFAGLSLTQLPLTKIDAGSQATSPHSKFPAPNHSSQPGNHLDETRVARMQMSSTFLRAAAVPCCSIHKRWRSLETWREHHRRDKLIAVRSRVVDSRLLELQDAANPSRQAKQVYPKKAPSYRTNEKWGKRVPSSQGVTRQS